MLQVKNDAVDHPSHYVNHPSGIECIEITKHHDFCIGNAIKYLWRAGLKVDAKGESKEIEDLKKAIWYIKEKIEELSNKKVKDPKQLDLFKQQKDEVID